MAPASARTVEEVQVVSGHGNALLELWGAESDQNPGHIGESLFGLAFGRFRQRRIGTRLLHHRAGAQLGKAPSDPDRINQVGAFDLVVDRAEYLRLVGGVLDVD